MAIPSRARQRISRPHDARAIRSREALGAALLELVSHKAFDDITIKEITVKAGVSYPVFFRQFSSKEDLLAHVATDEVRNLLSQRTGSQQQDDISSLLAMCQYIQKRRKLWVTLLTTGVVAEMRKEFSRIAAEISVDRPRANPAIPRDLIDQLVINGIFDILSWWLRQEESFPVETIVKFLESLVVERLARPVAIDLEPIGELEKSD